MSFSKKLKKHCQPDWEAGYLHPFVQELGQGTLAVEKFQFYLLQDYLYLFQYAKVFALGVVKSNDPNIVKHFVNGQYNILNSELDLHRYHMLNHGISSDEITNIRPSIFNQTYTANMLAIGQTGDLAQIIATILPCAWVYCDYASRLKQKYQEQLINNPYRSWIDTYADIHFNDSFDWMFSSLDTLVAAKSEKERQEFINIFANSVKFENLFWEMAYHKKMDF